MYEMSCMLVLEYFQVMSRGQLPNLERFTVFLCEADQHTICVLGWSVGGKFGEIVLNDLSLFHLLLEDVLLVQKEDD